MAKLSSFTATKSETFAPLGEYDEAKKEQPGFRVGYSGNEAYTSRVAVLSRKQLKKFPGREIPPAVFSLLQKQAMIGTILLGWTGLYADEAETVPLEFTPENAAKVLGTPMLFNVIEGAAADLANFQDGEEAASKAAVKSGDGVEPPVQ